MLNSADILMPTQRRKRGHQSNEEKKTIQKIEAKKEIFSPFRVKTFRAKLFKFFF